MYHSHLLFIFTLLLNRNCHSNSSAKGRLWKCPQNYLNLIESMGVGTVIFIFNFPLCLSGPISILLLLLLSQHWWFQSKFCGSVTYFKWDIIVFLAFFLLCSCNLCFIIKSFHKQLKGDFWLLSMAHLIAFKFISQMMGGGLVVLPTTILVCGKMQ